MFLVVVLTVAAHNLKPFSLPGVAGYMLQASTSFNLLLPQAAVAGLEGASLMVAALGTSNRTVGNHVPAASCPEQSGDEGVMAFGSVVLPEGQIKVSGPKRKPSFGSAVDRRAKSPRAEAVVLPQVREIADLVALQLPSREVAWMPVRNEVMARIAARRVNLPPVPKRVVLRPASFIEPKMNGCDSEKMKEIRIAVDLDRERKADEKRRSMAAEHKTRTQTVTVEEIQVVQSEGEIN